MADRLPKYRIENFSGVKENKIIGKIPRLKKGRFKVLPDSLGGDAPKDFIQFYKYEKGVKRKPSEWPKFLAKFGHKWYPVESITEHLLMEIGRCFNLNMAESSLFQNNGQIRFLSKYFLTAREQLEHGAQIYSACLSEHNAEFVEEIENKGWSSDLFTFQFSKEAIEFRYKGDSESILNDFVKMLTFDAVVGNHDRHFYNWGVVTKIDGSTTPTFSPIYDTARGLFWNFSEDKIAIYLDDLERLRGERLNKYMQRSKPKIGIENKTNINHFTLVNHILDNYPQYRKSYEEVINSNYLERSLEIINTDFSSLLSSNRRNLISECLKRRFGILQASLT